MAQPIAENVLGAVVFFSYIAAALFFTSFIGRDLFLLYCRKGETANENRSVIPDSPGRVKSRVFIQLSAISFSVLSFQMLSFLIQSYSQWSGSNEIQLPSAMFGNGGILNFNGHRTPVLAWKWSTQSTLFQDFAQTIVDNPRRFWWTQQALLYSMGWNTYMAIEGTRYHVPHLWAYFVLDQILPISFTQNLFCAALFLSPSFKTTDSFKGAAPGDQFVVMLVYLLSLSATPHRIGQPSFFVLLFAIRVLLFIPCWMLKPTLLDSTKTVHNSYKSVWWEYRYAGLVLGAGGLFLHVQQTLVALPFLQTVKSVQDNPAVAALAYDYMIGIVSLVIFYFLRQS